MRIRIPDEKSMVWIRIEFCWQDPDPGGQKWPKLDVNFWGRGFSCSFDVLYEAQG